MFSVCFGSVRCRNSFYPRSQKLKFACLRNKVRTTHRITTKLSSYCPSHGYYLMRFWQKFSWKLLFWQIFFKIFGCVFSRSNTILAISQQWLVQFMWNEKEVHRLDTGYNTWPWTLTSLMTLTLNVSKVKCQNSCISGIVGLIDVKWKGSELIWYWAYCSRTRTRTRKWFISLRVHITL